MSSISSLTRPSFSGLATGLDTGALIEGLLLAERRPLDLLEERRSRLETQRGLLQDLNTKLLALRDAARALDNRTDLDTGPATSEEFLATRVSSSDETVVTATSDGGVTPGTIRIDSVSQLARVGREFSAAFSSQDTALGQTGTLQVDLGTAGVGPGVQTLFTVTVDSTDSLVDIKDKINADVGNAGRVRADVVFDGSTYRLMVSSAETGRENEVTLTPSGLTDEAGTGPFLDAALEQTAQDAQLTLFGGLSVTSASNTVQDVVSGLTLQVKSTTATPVDLTVEIDKEEIESRLQAFVDAYNDVVDFVERNSAFDEEENTRGPLAGDPTVSSALLSLQRILSGRYDDGDDTNPGTSLADQIQGLAEIGISFDANGRLGLDGETLAEKLDANPLAVRELFRGLEADEIGPRPNGLAASLVEALDPLVRSGDGVLAVRDQSFQSQLDSLADQIANAEARLSQKEESLVLQFTRLETTVSQLQGMSDFLGSVRF